MGRNYHHLSISEMHRQYDIIARPRRAHAYQSQVAHDISRELSEQLSQYMASVNVLYVPPSFIVCLKNPNLQMHLLSHSPLRTTNYELDLLPWSKEHELDQLPWIIGTIITTNTQLLINFLGFKYIILTSTFS